MKLDRGRNDHALTVDAKLSSTTIWSNNYPLKKRNGQIPSKIMLAASLETSDPEIFIAMPRSAFLSAGESFTLSPVLVVNEVKSSWEVDTTHTPTM